MSEKTNCSSRTSQEASSKSSGGLRNRIRCNKSAEFSGSWRRGNLRPESGLVSYKTQQSLFLNELIISILIHINRQQVYRCVQLLTCLLIPVYSPNSLSTYTYIYIWLYIYIEVYVYHLHTDICIYSVILEECHYLIFIKHQHTLLYICCN